MTTDDADVPESRHDRLRVEDWRRGGVDRLDTVDIFAHLDGGGPSGQAGALRLAIARALIIVQPEDRPPLKKAGFLTRDPRAIERKKYGLKKARKAPQYSKR